MSSNHEEKKGWFARLTSGFTEAAPTMQAAYGVGAVAGIFLLVLIIALIVGIVFGETDSIADIISIVRDMFLILLAMQALLISLAIIVLILQIASAINLIQHEFNAIVHNLAETSQTIKGTTEFVSENVAEPVIESRAWIAALLAFFRELTDLRKTVQTMNQNGHSEPEPDEDITPFEPEMF